MIFLVIASILALADDEQGRLPGGDLSVVQAERQALYVIEAKILDLGGRWPDRSREHGLLYPQVIIEPSRGIKGAPTDWVKVSLRQVGLRLTEKDAVPREGEVYILYIEGMNRGKYVFKVTRPDGAVPIAVTGRDIGLAEAEKAATYVIEARISDLGVLERDPNRPRGLVYPRIAIEPSVVIKGEDRAATLAIRRVRLAFAREETVPEQGKTYTLYLRGSDRVLEVFRFTQRSQDRPTRLPGSDLSVAEAKRQALYVIEAKILRLGEQHPDQSQNGGLRYPRVTIEASRAFKGALEIWTPAPQHLSLVLTQNDTVPREGEVYILYIEKRGRESCVFKVARPDGAIPLRVSGSNISVTEAEKKALYVIEAAIQNLGALERDPNRPRGLVYPQVAIEPSKVIKGVDKAAALAIRRVRLAFTRDETVLEAGRRYTLYLREADRGFEVFRFTQRSQDRPTRLPGSDLSVAEAERKALYVVEARILHLGELREVPGRPRGLVYPQVAIEPSKAIHEKQQGIARSKRDVRLFLTEDETIPNEGETYTLYIRGANRGFEVFKVTRRSEEKPH